MSNSILLPAVQAALDANDIQYKVFECDEGFADTAAFCDHYNFSLQQAANTIIISSRKVDPTIYVACVNLATTRLDVNKKIRVLMGVKRISFADSDATKDLTGMLIGGVVIFGIKDVPIYIDSAVMEQKQVVMGGGNRHSKVILDPKELLKIKNIEIVKDLAKPKDNS